MDRTRIFKVTTPNDGEQYTQSIIGVFDLLDNDGWCWGESGCFHCVMDGHVVSGMLPVALNDFMTKHELIDYELVQGLLIDNWNWTNEREVKDKMNDTRVSIKAISILS